MKFTGKWMEIEKSHTEWGNHPDQERPIWYVFPPLYVYIKSMITNLYRIRDLEVHIERKLKQVFMDEQKDEPGVSSKEGEGKRGIKKGIQRETVKV